MRLRGELDLATSRGLEELLSAARSRPASTVVVDLSQVSFIDACSVGVIVTAWLAAGERGQRFGVEGLAGLPARVFEILELDWLLLRPAPPVDRQKGGYLDLRRTGGVQRHPARGSRGAR